MASVTPRTNKDGTVTWRVQFRIDGRMVGESFGDPDLPDSRNEKTAREFGELVDRVGGAEARKILQSRLGNGGKTPTLAEFTADYLNPASGLLTGIQPGTRHGYESIARNSFLPMLGEYPINAIDKAAVGKWVAWQEAQPSAARKGQLIAAKTVRNYHALLSNIFAAAVDLGFRADNPAKKTRLSAGMAREPVFLSRDEFQRLYEAIDPYYRPLVAFLVGSQARWSEATALTWADVNTDTVPPTVRISRAWKKNPGGTPTLSVPKSKRGRRTISLWPELVALLGLPGKPDDFVFPAKRTRRKIWYSSFNGKIWANAIRDAGLERVPNIHDLRHTGASWLIADGQPLPYIQERLGHESITTTVHTYGHLMPDAHTRMAASLQGVLSNVLPIGVKKISAGTDPKPVDED